MPSESPPPAAEPDTLRGELLERLTVLVDAALAGSVHCATVLSTALQHHAPSLVAPMIERCGRARAREREDT